MDKPATIEVESRALPEVGETSIWKYELISASHIAPFMLCDLECQADTKFIYVSIQGGKFCVWAVIEPSAKLVSRQIWIVGTGVPIPTDAIDYIGTLTAVHSSNPTIQIPNGKQKRLEYLWHFFAGKETQL